MKISEAKIIAEAMIKAAEKSGEKIAQGIKDGLCEGFSEVAKGLHGTRAELMMDVLLRQSEVDGGKIPEPGSAEWNKSKEIAKRVLEEFSDEK